MHRRRISIGIVEDDDSVRASLRTLLEVNKYDVIAFNSAEELIHPMMVDGCTCLIIDVDLPGENGFALLTRLKGLGYLKPALFVTGYVQDDMTQRAARLNAELLRKPIAAPILLQRVASLAGG